MSKAEDKRFGRAVTRAQRQFGVAVVTTQALDHLDAACRRIDDLDGLLPSHAQRKLRKQARRLSWAIDDIYYRVAALRDAIGELPDA